MDTEGATQLKDVSGVLACGLVPQVAEHLHWCRDAGNRHAAHLARDKALGRVAKRPTARLRLNPSALFVEGDRAVFRPLDVGAASGSQIEVRSGAKGGEEIVADAAGARTWRAEQKVRIKKD